MATGEADVGDFGGLVGLLCPGDGCSDGPFWGDVAGITPDCSVVVGAVVGTVAIVVHVVRGICFRIYPRSGRGRRKHLVFAAVSQGAMGTKLPDGTYTGVVDSVANEMVGVAFDGEEQPDVGILVVRTEVLPDGGVSEGESLTVTVREGEVAEWEEGPVS